ncbi:MAG: hypothetical protein QG602_3443 [Verrucomicrobiota bacterium]|nr:hypothetical protein [Verrucomicrobiota bacterium]
MANASLANRSNIFGTTSSSQGSSFGSYSWPADPGAADMFKFLKHTADQNLEYLRAAAEWMGTAASQGQNGLDQGLVRYQHVRPTPETSSSATTKWTATPAFPTLPNFPTMPEALKVNLAQIQTDFTADLGRLETSWLTSYLPASPTEVSALDSMLDNVLDGTYYNSMTAKLNTLELELKGALSTAITAMKSAMTTSIADLNTTLDGRRSGLDGKVDDALTVASNNVQNIAWARARGQAVAEAARAESEAATLWASRGFSIPPGVLTYQALAAGQTTTNAAIAIAADQAVRSQEFFFNVAVKDIDSYLSSTQIFINTDLENYKAEFTQRLATMKEETDQNRAKVKQALDHIGLSLDFSKFAGDTAMKYRLGVNDAIAKLVTAYSQFFRDEIQYASQTAEAQRQFLASLVDYYRAAIQASELSMKGVFGNTANDLRYAEISAGFINQAVSNHVRAAAETGNMYAQAASYALNGMTGIATKAE